jgi:SAM-dependent methyltransferase
MPALNQNLSVWDQTYDWSRRGDEWSDAWGGVSYHWWTTLFPRLQGYVPAGRVLEIAPGFGRWTHFLRDLCSDLIIVDIAESAIAHCRERFAADRHISAHVNDGTSLPMAEDGSIDLVFSFDSLVHAESDVMAGYLGELARILATDGVAFLHHSNMGAYARGTYDPNNIHWRATSVSATEIERLAEAVGLSCVSQETIAWGNDSLLNDCLSVITRAGSRFDRENVVVENLEFTRGEIAMARSLSTQYPRSRPDVRFGYGGGRETEHSQALDLLRDGEPEEARRLLLEQVRRINDPEALNDLAVLTAQCGDRDAALDLLRALARLHPEDAAAAENLAALQAVSETQEPAATRSSR